MIREVVNEKTSCQLNVQFKGFDGALAQPNTVQTKIVDVESGAIIRNWKDETPTAGEMNILIDDTDNVLRDSTKSHELRRVTVVGTYGAGDGVTEEYEYLVKNLGEVEA